MSNDHEAMTDELLTTVQLGELERCARRRMKCQVCEFRLTLRTNGLVLAGRVSTYYAKQLAQHAVMDAVDLPICANEIEVV